MININKNKTSKAVCFGAGLLALDVVMNGNQNTQPKFLAGGSCGNVLTILAFLGWNSYPIARLSNKPSAQLLFADLKSQKVNLDLVTQSEDGSTPIIIHRILKDAQENPKHRYEFKIPKTNIWFPSFKPVLSNRVNEIEAFHVKPKVFYFDRVCRANIELAKRYKESSCLIFFEPSSMGDEKQFNECLALADILKYSNDRLPLYKTHYRTRQTAVEIETLGAGGLSYRSFRNKSNEWKILPALEIDTLLDAAGGGDWCSSGIIHALFDSFETFPLKSLTALRLENILVFGQFLSALNCKFHGARGLMYNVSYSKIKRTYKKYLKNQVIFINEKEKGFALTNAPYDFRKLL